MPGMALRAADPEDEVSEEEVAAAGEHAGGEGQARPSWHVVAFIARYPAGERGGGGRTQRQSRRAGAAEEGGNGRVLRARGKGGGRVEEHASGGREKRVWWEERRG